MISLSKKILLSVALGASLFIASTATYAIPGDTSGSGTGTGTGTIVPAPPSGSGTGTGTGTIVPAPPVNGATVASPEPEVIPLMLLGAATLYMIKRRKE